MLRFANPFLTLGILKDEELSPISCSLVTLLSLNDYSITKRIFKLWFEDQNLEEAIEDQENERIINLIVAGFK